MQINTLNGIINIDLNTISLDDISEILSEFSVETDSLPDAPTVLYSGNIFDNYHSKNIAVNLGNVRIIDDTELGKFLSNDADDSAFNQILNAAIRNDIQNKKLNLDLFKNDENYNILCEYVTNVDTLTETELENVVKLASNAYKFEPTQGAWAIASELFIKATPTNSEIICITPEADLTRTWAQVEIPTALDNLSDDTIFGGYTISELKAVRDAEGLEAVQNMLKQHSSQIIGDIQIFYNLECKIIGADMSCITGGSSVNIPDGTKIAISVNDIRGFPSNTELSSLFSDFDSYTVGEKFSLKYIYSTIDKNESIDKLMTVYENTSVYGSEKFNDITIYINDDGNIIQSSLKNSGETASSSVKYTANIAELKEFGLIDDVELTRRIGDEFEGLTFAQRWQMKEYFTYHCALEDLLLDPMNPAAQAA